MSPAPFRGLAADEPEHAELFHGREALTAELLDLAARSRERGRPFTVVGPSGSGKSSLLRAGPIPALGGDGSPLPGEWTCVILTPGERPLRGPAGRLAGPAGRRRRPCTASCGTPRRPAPWYGRRLGACAEGGRRVLLVVDQFVELFSYVPGRPYHPPCR